MPSSPHFAPSVYPRGKEDSGGTLSSSLPSDDTKISTEGEENASQEGRNRQGPGLRGK